MKTKALALDERNPPSRLTVALHEAGWIWNEDWSWTYPRTGTEFRQSQSDDDE